MMIPTRPLTHPASRGRGIPSIPQRRGIRSTASAASPMRRPSSRPPLGRPPAADDVAEAAEYLALGASMTTGQVLVVDGGRTM